MTRTFLFAALAVLVVLGLGGQMMAADMSVATNSGFHVYAIERPAGNVSPDAAAIVAGAAGWNLYPQTGYPCYAPNSPCTTDPSGSVVMGIPNFYWPITGSSSTCVVTTQTCGQIFAWVQTVSASGAATAAITMKQGKATVFSAKPTSIGTVSANSILAVTYDGPAIKTTAKDGTATITVTTKVGSSTAKSTGTVYLGAVAY